MPTVLDLFSGMGGFSLAFEFAGFQTVGFAETCENANTITRYFYPDAPNFGDITKIRGADILSKIGPIDVVTAGVPCQPASALGQMRGTSDERWLWPEFIRLVSEIRPRYFIAENPPSILVLEGGRAWNGIVSEMVALGYDLWWDVFPAAAAGAGHLRERLYLVATDAKSERQRESANETNAIAGGWRSRNEPGNGDLSAGASSPNTDSERFNGQSALLRQEQRADPEIDRRGMKTGRRYFFAMLLFWFAAIVAIVISVRGEITALDTASTNRVDTINIGATFRGGNETNTMTVITGNRVIQIEVRATNFNGRSFGEGTGLAVRAEGSRTSQFDSATVQTNDAPVRRWHGAMTEQIIQGPTMPASTNKLWRINQLANPPPPLPPELPLQPKARRAMLQYFKRGGQKAR